MVISFYSTGNGPIRQAVMKDHQGDMGEFVDQYIGIVICTNNIGPYYNYIHHRKNNCTDRCCIQDITIGKRYQTIPSMPGKNLSTTNAGREMYHKIIDDMGEEHNYYQRDFITLGEHRSKFIEDITRE